MRKKITSPGLEPAFEDELEAATVEIGQPAKPEEPSQPKKPTEEAALRPAEEWARVKGHVDKPRSKGSPDLDLTAQRAWIFATTKRHAGWPIGLLLTESEYDAAVQAAGNVSMG